LIVSAAIRVRSSELCASNRFEMVAAISRVSSSLRVSIASLIE
jgi:hypothetical protein